MGAGARAGDGILAHNQGDYARTVSLFEEGLELDQARGKVGGAAVALHNLGNVAHEQGDYGCATVLDAESLRLKRDAGDKWEVAVTLNNLGNVAREQGTREQGK